MISNKSVKLWSVLTPSEKKNVRFVIKNKSNDYLKNLLSLFEKNEKEQSELTKEMIFQQVFEKPYQPELDFKLRNEFRLFNEILEEVMDRETLIDSYPNVFYKIYLSELMKRGLSDIADKELEKWIESTSQGTDIQSEIDFRETLLEHELKSSKLKRDDFSRLRDKIFALMELNARAYNEKIAILKTRLRYTERVLKLFNPEFTPIETSRFTACLGNQYTTKLTSYYRLKEIFYDDDSVVRLKAMKDCYNFLLNNKNLFKDVEVEITKLQIQLGTELLLQLKLEDSENYFKKVIPNLKKLDEIQLAGFYFNYISCLSRLEKYDEAVALIENNPFLLRIKSVQERFLCVHLMLLILSGSIDKAERIYPLKIKEGEMDTYYYFRLVYAIIHYKNNQLDLVKNELLNLKTNLKNSKVDKLHTQKLIDLFMMFIKFLEDEKIKSKSKIAEKKVQLLKEVSHFPFTEVNFNTSSLIQKWLVHEVKKNVS